MKTVVIGNTTATIPEGVVFYSDYNYINVKSTNGTGKITVSITFSTSGATRNISYASELSDITFCIDSTLKSMQSFGSGNAVTVTVTSTLDGTLQGTSSFTLKCYFGKTLPYRYHGSENVIMFSNVTQLERLQVYLPAPGAVTTTGGTVLATSDEAGIVTVNASNLSDFKLRLDFAGDAMVGNVWNSYNSADKAPIILLKKVCEDEIGLTLHYYNADGCERLAFGKFIKNEIKADSLEYVRALTTYRDASRRLIKSTTSEITLFFNDIDEGCNFSDLLNSEKIWIVVNKSDQTGQVTTSSEEVLLTPTDDSVTEYGKTTDYAVKFKIMQ